MHVAILTLSGVVFDLFLIHIILRFLTWKMLLHEER